VVDLSELFKFFVFLYGLWQKRNVSFVVYCLMVILLQIQCCFAPFRQGAFFFFFTFFWVKNKFVWIGSGEN
jgi:hypothetical protein